MHLIVLPKSINLHRKQTRPLYLCSAERGNAQSRPETWSNLRFNFRLHNPQDDARSLARRSGDDGRSAPLKPGFFWDFLSSALFTLRLHPPASARIYVWDLWLSCSAERSKVKLPPCLVFFKKKKNSLVNTGTPNAPPRLGHINTRHTYTKDSGSRAVDKKKVHKPSPTPPPYLPF